MTAVSVFPFGSFICFLHWFGAWLVSFSTNFMNYTFLPENPHFAAREYHYLKWKHGLSLQCISLSAENNFTNSAKNEETVYFKCWYPRIHKEKFLLHNENILRWS